MGSKIKNKYLTAKLMNGINNRSIVYAGIAFTAIVFFFIIWEITFATHDDIEHYLLFRIGGFPRVLRFQDFLAGGRIFQSVQGASYVLIHLGNSFLSYKLIFYLYICFSVFSLWYLLYTHVNRNLSLLAVLLFFIFAQINAEHNAFISYPGAQVHFGIMIFSVDRLLVYYKTNKRKKLVWSAIFLVISSVMYEAFVMYSLLLFVISIVHTYDKNIKFVRCIWKALYDLRFHIILMIVYLAVYMYVRSMATLEIYDGVRIDLSNMRGVLNTLVTYSLSFFPLNSFFRLNISDVYKYIDFLTILKAVVSVFVFVQIVQRIQGIDNRKALIICGLSVLGIVLPVTLVSMTPNYVNWVLNHNSYGYLPSFYSYFGIVALLSVLCAVAYQRTRHKVLVATILSCLIFFGSILTDVSNKVYAQPFTTNTKRYMTLDKAVSSEFFAGIENGAVVYVPDYYGIHNDIYSINRLTHVYIPENRYSFTNRIDEITFDRPVYILKYSDGSMLMSRVDSNMQTDEFTIISLAALDDVSVVINQEQSGFVYINGDSSYYDEAAAIPLDLAGSDTVTIRGNNFYILDYYILREMK